MQANYCPYCLRLVQSTVCPNCGSDVNYTGNPMHMAVGSILNGGHSYILGAARGQGGFGITYIALDIQTGNRVAVKEYFPTHCAGRNNGTLVQSYYGQEDVFSKGRERFLLEAKMLQSLSDLHSVVKVLDYFEANNTAYLVMEFLEGSSLNRFVEKNGRFPVQQFLHKLRPLMEDMARMHERGVIHRDVAPDNIILQPDGCMKLIDFGAARTYLGDTSMTVVVKKGFAPVEQYMRRGSGPATDVYALAATIYYCLTGIIPPDSAERQYGEKELESPSVYGVELTPRQDQTLMKALAIQPKDRLQTIPEFLDGLFEEEKKASFIPPRTLLDKDPGILQTNCPVIIESLKLVQDFEDPGLYVVARFRNISARTVQFIDVEVSCVDQRGAWSGNLLQNRVDCGEQGLPSCSDRSVSIAVPETNVQDVFLLVREVRFSDGATQVCGTETENIPELESLESFFGGNKELCQEYLRKTSSQAKWKPVSGNGFWRCGCGCLNTLEQEKCPTCHTDKEAQFSFLSPELLAQSLAERKAEQERMAQLEAEKLRIRKEHQKKFLRLGTAVAATVLVICSGVYGISYAISQNRYSKASILLEEGRYDEAYPVFLALDNFKDSRDKADSAMYLKGMDLLEQHRYDEAYSVFFALNGFMDSREKAHSAMYFKGEQLLDSKAYQQAANAFSLAADYKDSQEKVKYCENEVAYQDAETLFLDGNYGAAAEAFRALGSHSDSPERALDAQYRYASGLLSSGSYTDAYEAFTMIPDYLDSRDKANESYYLYAQFLTQTGEYHEAYLTYVKILDYQDSRTLSLEAEYTYASICAESNRYQDAIAAYGNIPDYRDVKTRLQEVKYQYASLLASSSDWEHSSNLFAELKGYKDSTTQYQSTRYQYGCQLIGKKQYQDAVSVFEELGYYSDSKTQLNEAKYLYALAHKSKTNSTTFQYLKDLQAVNYKDSKSIYKQLFSWKVTMTAVNTDPYDYSTIKKSVSRYCNFLHFQFKLEGGGPGEEVTLYAVSVWPDGSSRTSTWYWENKTQGNSCIIQWAEGIYSRPENGTTGTLTVRVYIKGTNECIGEGSVTITSS